MSVSFEWELDKQEAGTSRGPDKSRPPPVERRRRLFRGALVLALLVASGFGAYAWVRSQLNAAKMLEADLRRSVEFELEAIAEGDVELLFARLDPADPRWQVRQLARYSFVSEAPGFAPAPGLTIVGRPAEITQVHVSGRAGRVKLVQWYQPSSQTLTSLLSLRFHVTWFYRRDDDGAWYHVSPPDGFGNMDYTWRGARLVLRATETEAGLLDPIARELDSLIVRGCRLLDCPEGACYTLTFRDTLFPQINGDHWVLPALYLAGFPEGEESRVAWQHVLKLWLPEALIQAQLKRQELTDWAFFRQLVARLQAELGLREPALPDVEPLAELLAGGDNHTLQDLWQAEGISADSDEKRLVDAEVDILMQVLETEVGLEHLFELLPALHRNKRLEPFLLAHYRLDPNDLQGAWVAYLSELTGVPVTPEPTRRVYPQPVEAPSGPPPLPKAPPVRPGNQIALVCNGQIWVGNLDGSNMVPLTDAGQRFDSVYWSPDGRWLLTNWHYAETFQPSALYLLAADGSEGRLLSNDAESRESAAGWSPDGRAVYFRRPAADASRSAVVETRMLDVDEDVAYQLPYAPRWSPDGQHLVYIEQSPTDPFSTIWLADANALASGTVETADGHVVLQGNGRQITDQVEGLSNAAWSPDGSKLALTLGHEDPNRSALAIFDLATENLTPLVTLADLKTRVQSGGALLLFRGYDRTELTVEPLVRLSVNGWAADGRRLLVTAKGESEWRTREGPTALIMVPLDGGPPRLLAYAQSGAAYGVSWSPTNADQFTVAWQSGSEPNPRAFLFDLGSGLLYTAAESWNAAWSPDGTWAAFAGQNQVTIVDQEGRPRSILRPHNFCSLPAWNTTTKITLPDATCSLGLDLRIDDQDVYQVGDDLLIRVQNGGDQPMKNVPARVVDGAGNISEPMGLGPLPACGSLLMRIATRDWTSPLTVILNSPEDPSILTEGDHSNNQVTVTLD